ncbi:MAG: HAMP domain-containing histidine kinase [Bacteroides sp.]|nr:HAMP domain-containing histidine kinase [Bacillota bacterium]MCM1393413.1 HAMP domain-containing histidine kinase [[Eubacterium] siraeum]MCM1455399.1 HAMP domain-containing histidine kinase [Bacteroides sp.]
MDLIKRQRIKFTVVTTALGAVLLLILLGGFFIMTYVSDKVSMTTALDKALNAPNSYNAAAPQALRCFFVYSDDSGVVKVKGDLTYYGDDKDKIAKKACGELQGTFKVGKYHFICASKELENGTLTAVIDRTEHSSLLLNTGLQIAMLYCLSVILIALLAFLASARLLYPVSESFKKQRDLVANASHELKTPLTVISTNLSVIKSEPNTSVADNAHWIESIDAQITRMQDLIQNMLELSKMEQVEIPKEELNFSMLLEGACLTFEPICFEKNVNLTATIAPDVTVKGDKNALERLIVILLDNAIKYCYENGKVGVKLSADPKRVRLSVMNTGEAISKEEALHVFDRFYRTDGARKNEDGRSFGLGLSIAEATVKAHGGTISCHGVEDKGTVFTVLLPAIKEKKKK